MGTTVRLRSRAARALGVAMELLGAAGLVSVAAEGLDPTLRFAAPLGLLGLLGWAAFLEPYVEVSDAGVTVANTLRTVTVPWPAIESADGRYGLKLITAYGPVTAWAAQAPVGRQRARGQNGPAATEVLRRLQELREAGHLDDRRLERPRAQVSWHSKRIAALLALTVAGVLLPLLA